MLIREQTVAYEHPKWGLCFVTFAWRRAAQGWMWVPVAAEWDLFCPVVERDEMARDLEEIRSRLQPPPGANQASC